MGLLDGLFNTTYSQGKDALLQEQLLKNQAMATALAKSRAQGTAQAQLLGGFDPSSGANLQAPPPQQPGTRMVAPSYPLMGGQSTAPITQGPLLGQGDNGQLGLLGSGAPDMRQTLLNRADPDTAMARAQMQANPLFANLPQDQRTAAMLAPKEFGAQYAKTVLPDPTPQQKVAAAVAKMNPNDPSRAPLQAWLDKEGYIREKDPLVIADMKAGIADKEANARKSGLQADMLQNSGLDPDSMERVYQQWKGGQPLNQIIPNLGRGQQGAQQIVALQNYFTKRMSSEGMNPNAVAAAQVNLKAQTSAARKAADRGANVDMAAIELETFGDQALDAAAKVNNTNFVPWNKLVNMTNEQISDPNLAAMKTAIQGVKGAYASVLTRGGTPTVDAERRGDELLSAASGPGALKAVIAQMKNEAAGVKTSSKAVQADIGSRITGGPSTPTPVAPISGAKAQMPPGMVKQVGTLKGRPVYEDAQGNRHVDTGP